MDMLLGWKIPTVLKLPSTVTNVSHLQFFMYRLHYSVPSKGTDAFLPHVLMLILQVLMLWIPLLCWTTSIVLMWSFDVLSNLHSTEPMLCQVWTSCQKVFKAFGLIFPDLPCLFLNFYQSYESNHIIIMLLFVPSLFLPLTISFRGEWGKNRTGENSRGHYPLTLVRLKICFFVCY